MTKHQFKSYHHNCYHGIISVAVFAYDDDDGGKKESARTRSGSPAAAAGQSPPPPPPSGPLHLHRGGCSWRAAARARGEGVRITILYYCVCVCSIGERARYRLLLSTSRIASRKQTESIDHILLYGINTAVQHV